MQTDFRRSAPQIKEVEKIFHEEVQEKVLAENTVFSYINDTNNPTVKLSLKLNAGSWFEHKKLIATTCARLAKSGTISQKSAQIAEAIDCSGGKLIFNCMEDHAWITLRCLSENLPELLGILSQLFKESTFPQTELDIHKKHRLQQLKLNNKKTEYLAQKHFFASVFGSEHPYGFYTEAAFIDALERKDLLDFFESNYTRENLQIMGVGNFNEQYFGEIEKLIQSVKSGEGEKQNFMHPIQPALNKEIFIPVKDAEQVSLAMGNRSPLRSDPEYIDYSIMIALLGGYFGSRLMMNLREKKGLTYGIYAQIQNYKHSGCLVIQAELKKGSGEKAIGEVFFEMERLKHELVSNEELRNLKQYLSGNLLSMLDGKLRQYEMLRQFKTFGLDEDFLYRYFNRIKKIEPEDIQQLALKYLDKNSFFTVISGA
ncbi:MAG: insulinase family protein [Chitinophagaceae bacterium]|nr:MAG: insulinase family protein [Chitinophagaceae bacterium]